MADMDVDTPAPSKKDGKEKEGKQRFEVKKVRYTTAQFARR
jgi:hypothetical protein